MNISNLNTSKTTNSLHNTISWYTPIDKLMLWRGSWTKYDRDMSNLFLRVFYDQLLITANTKILESFNIHHKIKGIYKNDVLIIIVSSNNQIRKIKFQIKNNIADCLQALGRHFPVVNYNTPQSNQVINLKFRSIDEVLKHAVDRKGNTGSSILPTEFEKFMKLCLLDPSFPEMVSETEKILSSELFKK